MAANTQNITWNLGAGWAGYAGTPYPSLTVSKTITFGSPEKIVTAEFPRISCKRATKKRRRKWPPLPISDNDKTTSKISKKITKTLFITNLRKT